MGNTNITSGYNGKQPALVQEIYSRVQYVTPSGGDYDVQDADWRDISRVANTVVTNPIGPNPATADITIPVGTEFGNEGIYDHLTYDVRGFVKEIAPFGPFNSEIKIFSKVRIFGALPNLPDARAALFSAPVNPNTPRIFVGYITEFEIAYEGTEVSEITIKCEDARMLLKKTPCSGLLFFNPEEGPALSPGDPDKKGETNYIRAKDAVFNEGGRPNRWFDDKLTGITDKDERKYRNHELYPRFIRRDHGRFDTGTNFYINDGLIDQALRPHARKWFALYIWNYYSNMIDENVMITNPLFDIPSGAQAEEDLMPLRTNTDPTASYRGEIMLPLLADTGDDKTMYHDWAEPRSVIGGTSIATATAVSSVGEFKTDGFPLIEMLFELCRRVGNYSLVATYDIHDRMVLRPIRICQAFDENKDVPVGVQGKAPGTGGGKEINILIPGGKATAKPDVMSMTTSVNTKSYVNRVYFKGGPQWAQVTFVTAGRDVSTDQSGVGTGQIHQPYDYTSADGAVPVGQWLPQLTLPTLVPGWTAADQALFIAEWSNTGDHGTVDRYQDVFRTWIVPQDGPNKIDWKKFFGDLADNDDNSGFRRFLDRDRGAMDALITSLFSVQSGIFRNSRQRLPIAYMRAFRGIPLDTDLIPAIGANGDPTAGDTDWFPLRTEVEVLTDGRFGFRVGPAGRQDIDKNFNGIVTPTGSPNKTPEVWNGQSAIPRSYELMWSIPIMLDEDLWQQLTLPKTGTRKIERHGPLLEFYRDAGSEFQMEHAKHSVVPRPNPALGQSIFTPEPPVDGLGSGDSEERIYRDDRDEVDARARMIGNRITAADIATDITIPRIDLSLQAGYYVDKLKEAGGAKHENIRIGSVITSVTYNFGLQQTQLRLETVR